jgi:hypothetical protein
VAKLTKIRIKLQKLEKQIKAKGVKVGYERLQFAGLRLRSGLCWFRGRYYLFVDRLKSVPERIELIQNALEDLESMDGGSPEEIPEQSRLENSPADENRQKQ